MSTYYNGSDIELFDRLEENENSEIPGPLWASDLEPIAGYSSPERNFQGFQKTPVVVLQRMDITPYLNNNNNSLNTGSAALHSVKKKENNDLSAFNKICSVKIVRDDLCKLLQSIRDSPLSNGTNMKCKICDKEYSSEKRLQNHQENKHMIVYKHKKDKTVKHVSFSDHVIVHEVNEYHRCRKCTKIFEDYKSLKSHMKEEHRKRKCYICYYCSKDFVDRTFFKVHIKLHCNVCGRLTVNRRQLAEHRKNVCKIIKSYPCKTCNISFFNFMDLKDHNYDHLGTYFICDICKERLQSKCAISHHISFLHLQKRPESLYEMRNMGNERLYLCNFCDESAVERHMIEQHTSLLPDLSNRAMTGYTDYYFCDQCLKQFDTEKAMLHHKWSHFLNTKSDTKSETETLKKEIDIPLKFNVNNKIPDYMLPNVVVEKIKISEKVCNEPVACIDVQSFDIYNAAMKTAIVDPKSKKTIISKHQCQTCGKYFSSNYCLNRHIETQHRDYDTLTCKVCEETFVWPSLLQSHKCIRLNLPEMPFEDARPEIHFDNLNNMAQDIDDFNISDSVNYMDSVDFEIPAPVVELTEQDGFVLPNGLIGCNTESTNNLPKDSMLSNLLNSSPTVPFNNYMSGNNFIQRVNVLPANNVNVIPHKNALHPTNMFAMNSLQCGNTYPTGNGFPNGSVLVNNSSLHNTNVISNQSMGSDSEIPLHNGYKLVMQEVPIEF